MKHITTLHSILMAAGNLLIFCLHLHSQNAYQSAYAATMPSAGWYQTIGNSVTKTTDGGYLIAGETADSLYGYSKIFLMKTDSNGMEKWVKALRVDPYSASGNRIITAADGTFYLAGRTTVFSSAGESLIMHLDQNGNILWKKIFHFSTSANALNEATYISQTKDGHLIILGNDNSGSYIGYADSTGNILWNFNYFNSNVRSAVRESADGSLIMLIYPQLMIRLDQATGAVTDTCTLGANGSIGSLESNLDLLLAPDSNLIVFGTTDWANYNWYIAKVRSTNWPCYGGIFLEPCSTQVLWRVGYTLPGGFNGIDPRSFIQCPDGGYMVCFTHDTTISYINYKSIGLMKTDAAGNTQWTKLYNGFAELSGKPGGYSIASDNGNAVVAGYSLPVSGNGKAAYFLHSDAGGGGGSCGETDVTITSTAYTIDISGTVWDCISKQLYLYTSPLTMQSSGNSTNAYAPVMADGPQCQPLTTSIREKKNGQELAVSIFPNPFTSFSNISVSAGAGNSLRFVICDLEGREIEDVALSSVQPQFILDGRNLSAGMYLYKLLANGNIAGTGKIVIQ